MSEIPTEIQPIAGLAEAIARYGRPLERSFTLEVRPETLRYWRMRRKRAEVVILLRRLNGRYLVHTKGFYPPGVYRLISGALKPGEDLLAGLEREIHEETGLAVRVERFLAILRYRFCYREESLPFISYLFAVAELGGTLALNDPGEAISGYREVDLAELGALAAQLEALPPEWSDWGRFRAIAHRVILEILSPNHDDSPRQ